MNWDFFERELILGESIFMKSNFVNFASFGQFCENYFPQKSKIASNIKQICKIWFLFLLKSSEKYRFFEDFGEI